MEKVDRKELAMEVASSTLQASPTPNSETGQSSYLRSHSIADEENYLLRFINSGPDWGSPGMSFSTFSPDRSSGVTLRSSHITDGSSLDGDEPSYLRSYSLADGANDLTDSGPNCGRVLSDCPGMSFSTFSPDRSSGVTPRSSHITDGSSLDGDELSYLGLYSLADGANDLLRLSNSGRNCGVTRHSSQITEGSSLDGDEPRNSHCSSRYSVDMADDLAINDLFPWDKEIWPPSKSEGCMSEELYDHPERSLVGSENSRREAIDESMRHRKAENDAIGAINRAKAPERLYTEEERQRKEVEETIARGKEPKKMKQQVGEDTEYFSEFSFSEIEEATSNFNLSLKIGQGGYGYIYKGLLRHTEVAIKMLHSNSRQGPSEFRQEVTVLSKVRHPNIVTLIGACPEYFILVYEYLPNGSLQDRLDCKENSPPLSWQTRIRIARELCSALIFLHSCNPNSIVHGDVKPANILLDSNFVSKLGDFGISRILYQNKYSSNNTTLCHVTDPKGTYPYMDPEFCSTREITTKSDVYSFGIILLQLLTGRQALGITKEVTCALETENFKKMLDPTAGDWPFVQALELAHIALRCCKITRQSRPDLAPDVWRALDRMRVSCGAPPFLMNSKEETMREIPNSQWIASNEITVEHLRQHFGNKREDVANFLGISVSTLKRVCRTHGIPRWPNCTKRRVKRPPNARGKKNPSPMFKTLSTVGLTTVKEMGDQNPEPNEFQPNAFEDVNLWNTENGSMLKENPSLEGHVSGSVNSTVAVYSDPALSQQPMPTCSDLAPSPQPVPTIPHRMPTIHKMPNLAGREDMRTVMLKITCGDTKIKFKFPLTSGISELKEEVKKRLKLEPDSFRIEYKDEEGDSILLSSDVDLRDHLQDCSNQVIKLFAVDM